jgi:hypothetical protein
LEPHVESVQNELASLAALGDERTAAAAERLSRALGSTLGLRFLDLVSEAAVEISGQLPSGHVEVRMAGQSPSLVYVEAAEEEPATAGEELSARITLRLPGGLKGTLEVAAAREGVSVNTWVLRALARALSGPPPARRGNRMRGFARG